jgi:predicted  nucleic acid-binding Zn-ribbon protein
MDEQQLQELATNARLNHWPPHLGVRTEAEKIEYLADALDKQQREVERLGLDLSSAETEAEGLRDEIHECDDEITELKSKLDKIRNLTT